MKTVTEILSKSPLFKGIAEYSITPMMGCLRAKEKNYKKNEFIFVPSKIIKICSLSWLCISAPPFANR